MRVFVIALAAANIVIFLHLCWREAQMSDVPRQRTGRLDQRSRPDHPAAAAQASDSALAPAATPTTESREAPSVQAEPHKAKPPREPSLMAVVTEQGFLTAEQHRMADSRPWLRRTLRMDRSFLRTASELLGRPSSDFDDLLDCPEKVYRLAEGCKEEWVTMSRAREPIDADVERIADERVRTGRVEVEPAPFTPSSVPLVGEYRAVRSIPGGDGSKVYVIRIPSGDDPVLAEHEDALRAAQAAVASAFNATLKAIEHK